jgi:hypothetical protein
MKIVHFVDAIFTKHKLGGFFVSPFEVNEMKRRKDRSQ